MDAEVEQILTLYQNLDKYTVMKKIKKHQIICHLNIEIIKKFLF
mgnify:CR=1 FL=1